MYKYGENEQYDDKTIDFLSDNSIWITCTPTPVTQTLPFYIIEAGCFIAAPDYKTQREFHDSFLLIYTTDGQGTLKSGENTAELSPGEAVLIDCGTPHEYHASSDIWGFMWMHIKGGGIKAVFDMIYPDGTVHTVKIKHHHEFENLFQELITSAEKSNLESCMEVSSGIHSLCNRIYSSALDSVSSKKEITEDIQKVIEFIENNYSKSISIDDMVENIHISKYHFIRSFRRVMGITPYSFLINYRINISKKLLVSTHKTVQEISELCGFLDAGNFIAQFKKHTGQKPTQYKKDFT